MARTNMVLVYVPDPRFYVTEEADLPRRWYRLWQENYVLGETTTRDANELRLIMEARGLDPGRWREPSEADRQLRRGG